jgi:uncharacterized protein
MDRAAVGSHCVASESKMYDTGVFQSKWYSIKGRHMEIKKYTLCFSIFLLISSDPAEATNRPRDKIVTDSQTFINQHPDLMHRLRGVKAFREQRYNDAFSHFKHAAKYADKPSQGMLAEMLWNGNGVAVNKVQAYAWMDIAAERFYPNMLLSREKMWSLLTEAEREQVMPIGLQLYENYGDDVAKRRLEAELIKAKRSITGSHVGFVGTLNICLNPMECSQMVDGSVYYQDKFWKPEQYWQWQDTDWKSPQTGRVDVLPLEIFPNANDKK